MHLECSNCHQRYPLLFQELPSPLFQKDGRLGWKIICRTCHQEWFLEDKSEKNIHENSFMSHPDTLTPCISLLSSENDLTSNPLFHQKSRWIGVVVVSFLLAGSVVFFMPQIHPTYSKSKIIKGLRLQNLKTQLHYASTTTQKVSIEGSVINTSNYPILVPSLKIIAWVSSNQSSEVEKPVVWYDRSWTQKEIPPGEVIAFQILKTLSRSLKILRVEVVPASPK